MDFDAARQHMVDSQLITNRIVDPRLVEVMATLPREKFLPEERRVLAYIDEDVPVGDGRHLTEPMVIARMIQAVEPSEGDVALVVGCCTGYATAVLGKLVSTVVALESDHGLAGRAQATLAELGIDNAAVVEGPLAEGYAKQAPYDSILIDGQVPEVPAVILQQLAEGGRLATVEKPAGRVGRLVRYVRYQGAISKLDIFDASIPPLPGFERAETFVF